MSRKERGGQRPDLAGADGSWQQLFPPLGSDPPDRTAISFPDRSLSYAELGNAATRVAAACRRRS